MATPTATRRAESFASRTDFERWQARRRWARAGLVYVIMLFFALVLVGPLLFATVSSLKINPLDYPPTLNIPQLWPKNWAAAARLGVAGEGSRWFGGFAPGAEVPFRLTYFVPEAQEAETPEVVVPRRSSGTAQQAEFAADYATVSPVEEVSREPATYPLRGQETEGQLVTYEFSISYGGDGPEVDSLPVDVTTPVTQVFTDSTLSPSRIERRGRVASYDNLTPGALGYIFHNYVRVFGEARSATTGKSLFLTWTRNSFLVAIVRVLSTLLLASMAGYALARLYFPGKSVIFLIILFSMMIPGQVTFISNYLVLRDGIFGLTQLFGVPTLLNSLWAVIIGGASGSALVAAGMVFLMKQFFESIPREVEEAAMIDGASQWRRYWSVVLPMARPALGAVAILTFQGAWNEFFWPLIVLTSPDDIKTLPIGLLAFRQTYGGVGDWGLILAGAVLSTVPIIILFIVFQRYFLEGVSYGGSKE